MRFFRTDVQPTSLQRSLLSIPLFIAVIAFYLVSSHVRHQTNPADNVVPSITQIAHGAVQVATQPDRATNRPWLWDDLKATSARFGLSLFFVSLGVILGLHMGLFPYIEALMLNPIIALDKIVALSLLPLLMVMFGIEEGFRIALVLIAVFPTVVLSAYLEAKAYPEELRNKARTLGASEMELAYRVVLPGIMPKMLDMLRLNFKSIAMMVIAGEMIVASVGLGYRINAVRRYMSMDVVITYVIIITVLLFLADLAVSRFIKWRYPWFNAKS